MAQTGRHSIQVLMGVCDGDAHLPAQLQSLADQTDGDWQLLVSDDSAGTASRRVLDGFAASAPSPVQVMAGPRQGFAANYLHLIRCAAPGLVAFADQDDVWMPDKLARARAALAALPQDRPALYCARVQPWDGTRSFVPQPPLSRAPGFANALIENVATGNTVMLNAAAGTLAREMADRVGTVFAHDWWLYQLVTGVGGTVIHDDGPPVVLYRQHGGNAIGAGRGWAAQVTRKRAVLRGALAARLGLNAAALHAARDRLTADNAALLDAFEAARARRGPARLRALARLGLYRQRLTGTAGFFGAAALGLV